MLLEEMGPLNGSMCATKKLLLMLLQWMPNCMELVAVWVVQDLDTCIW